MSSSRIILLDDESFQLKLLTRQLANMGYFEVGACTSGVEALALIEGQSSVEKLVFVDLNMPDMDGVEFLRQLVNCQYTGALVLVSGEDERILETAERLALGNHLNVLGYLSKPVQPVALRALLDQWGHQGAKEAGKIRESYDATQVRHAIDGGELVNFYQPKVDVASGALVGVESLVRWRHPHDGLVFPEQFIAVAEEHDLIDDLTRTVLTGALTQAWRWRDEGLALRVAVNISMDNLRQLDFPDFVLDEIFRHGLVPSDIILELTESRLMKNNSMSLDILTRLRLKQVSLSIDDFGTGHSSLSQLRDIPFDELKIDYSFVHGAHQSATQRAIFGASLGMARELRMKTVAEGIEDRADWDFLRTQSCDLAQGFFIAKPMSAEDLPAWLAAWETRRLKLVPK